MLKVRDKVSVVGACTGSVHSVVRYETISTVYTIPCTCVTGRPASQVNFGLVGKSTGLNYILINTKQNCSQINVALSSF